MFHELTNSLLSRCIDRKRTKWSGRIQAGLPSSTPLKKIIYFSTPTSAFLILLKAPLIFGSCIQESSIESPLCLFLISTDFFYSVAKIIFSPALFTNFISTSWSPNILVYWDCFCQMTSGPQAAKPQSLCSASSLALLPACFSAAVEGTPSLWGMLTPRLLHATVSVLFPFGVGRGSLWVSLVRLPTLPGL